MTPGYAALSIIFSEMMKMNKQNNDIVVLLDYDVIVTY